MNETRVAYLIEVLKEANQPGDHTLREKAKQALAEELGLSEKSNGQKTTLPCQLPYNPFYPPSITYGSTKSHI